MFYYYYTRFYLVSSCLSPRLCRITLRWGGVCCYQGVVRELRGIMPCVQDQRLGKRLEDISPSHPSSLFYPPSSSPRTSFTYSTHETDFPSLGITCTTQRPRQQLRTPPRASHQPWTHWSSAVFPSPFSARDWLLINGVYRARPAHCRCYKREEPCLSRDGQSSHVTHRSIQI